MVGRPVRQGRPRAEFHIAVLGLFQPRRVGGVRHVEHDGYVYGLDDGVLVCLDPATGERCWKKGRYGHGQIILAEDLLLVTTEKGEVILIEPNPEEFRLLGSMAPFEGKTWNPPALAGSLLLLRTDSEAVLYELPVAG